MTDTKTAAEASLILANIIRQVDPRNDLSPEKLAEAILGHFGSCWGPAMPPDEEEVADLVAALNADADCVEVEGYNLCNITAEQMRRIAELLQQRHPTPVAVSERLPGPKDSWDWAKGATYWLPFHALPLPAWEGQS